MTVWPIEAGRWADYDRRAGIAWRTGACADAGYSRSEFALTVRHGDRLMTVAQLRVDRPFDNVARLAKLLGWP